MGVKEQLAFAEENGRMVGALKSASSSGNPIKQRAKKGLIARFVPLAILIIAAGLVWWWFGDLLSLESLMKNRDALLAWRDGNFIVAALAFVGAYAIVVALSLPGALWMTLAGGFMFGLWPGGLLNVGAATIGAVAIFVVARTSLGATLKEKAGPWLERLEAGFKRNEISYLLVMRLVPVVPFFIANLAPVFWGVGLWTFTWTTFVGILPGGLVYTWVGAGLGDVLDARGEPNLSIIFEPHVLGPILGLALLSMLPLLLKWLQKNGD
jgi:uncharacterized membrane protein YdjX (TVP38/TMEM64 family)